MRANSRQCSAIFGKLDFFPCSFCSSNQEHAGLCLPGLPTASRRLSSSIFFFGTFLQELVRASRWRRGCDGLRVVQPWYFLGLTAWVRRLCCVRSARASRQFFPSRIFIA